MPETTLEEAGVVGLTRATFAYGNERDFGAMLAKVATDCELDLSRIGLGTYEGKPAIRRFFEDWIGSFDDWRTDLVEVSDLGAGVVLVIADQDGRSGRLAITRCVFHMRYAAVYEWDADTTVRITNYVDLGEARLEAERLALQEPAGAEAA